MQPSVTVCWMCGHHSRACWMSAFYLFVCVCLCVSSPPTNRVVTGGHDKRSCPNIRGFLVQPTNHSVSCRVLTTQKDVVTGLLNMWTRADTTGIRVRLYRGVLSNPLHLSLSLYLSLSLSLTHTHTSTHTLPTVYHRIKPSKEDRGDTTGVCVRI